MITRIRWAGLIVFAAIALPGACLAADSTTVAHRAGIGGQIGGSFFHLEDDYSVGALPRFDFEGHFRYAFGQSLRLQVAPGFTWSAYSDKETPPFTDSRFPEDRTKKEYLALLLPVSAQLQYTWRSGRWHYHLGAGPGIYRVLVENHRKPLEDPQTFKVHRGLYPGGTAEAGVERYFKALPSTSVELAIVEHFVLPVRDEQFPSGWNSNLAVFGARLGINYYWDPLAEKAKKTPDAGLPGIP